MVILVNKLRMKIIMSDAHTLWKHEIPSLLSGWSLSSMFTLHYLLCSISLSMDTVLRPILSVHKALKGCRGRRGFLLGSYYPCWSFLVPDMLSIKTARDRNDLYWWPNYAPKVHSLSVTVQFWGQAQWPCHSFSRVASACAHNWTSTPSKYSSLGSPTLVRENRQGDVLQQSRQAIMIIVVILRHDLRQSNLVLNFLKAKDDLKIFVIFVSSLLRAG